MSRLALTLAGDLFASLAAAPAGPVHLREAAYERDRLASIELGSGREDVLEDLGTEFLRHAHEQFGLASTLRRPRAQSGPLPQPVCGTQRRGGVPGISLRERELRRGDKR